MNSEDFSVIAQRYKETSIVQKSAADTLLSILDIKEGEKVLDVGCGPGNLTERIYKLTNTLVVGIDQSDGMIEECKRNYKNSNLRFEKLSAEMLNYDNEFDVIFCNSTFQWIKNVEIAVNNFYKSLKKGGRIGIQAPAKQCYSPNFIQAISEIEKNPLTRDTFKNFSSPWLFLESAIEYSELFEKNSFKVLFSQIQTLETFHSPEETYNIFASGAIAGYLNDKYYEGGFDKSYKEEFEKIIKESFSKQATYDGKVKLIFNRIYLVAKKI